MSDARERLEATRRENAAKVEDAWSRVVECQSYDYVEDLQILAQSKNQSQLMDLIMRGAGMTYLVAQVEGGHSFIAGKKTLTVLKVGDTYKSFVTRIEDGEVTTSRAGETEDWITAYGRALNDVSRGR